MIAASEATLTLAAAPRAALAPHDILQRAAAKSWGALGDDVEVLLFGEEPGIAELASLAGARQLPLALRTVTGRPRLDEIFRRCQDEASAPLVAFVNADILLRRSLVDAVTEVSRQLGSPFVACSRRIETEPPGDDLGLVNEQLLAELATTGRVGPPFAVDFFAFSRGALRLPPFAIGAATWDNWIIYNALRRGLPVIDLSDLRAVIHQNHDEGYAAGKVPDWNDVEHAANLRLSGLAVRFDLRDASHELCDGQLRPTQGQRPRAAAMLHRVLTARLPIVWRAATMASNGCWRGRRGAVRHRALAQALRRPAAEEPRA